MACRFQTLDANSFHLRDNSRTISSWEGKKVFFDNFLAMLRSVEVPMALEGSRRILAIATVSHYVYFRSIRCNHSSQLACQLQRR